MIRVNPDYLCEQKLEKYDNYVDNTVFRKERPHPMNAFVTSHTTAPVDSDDPAPSASGQSVALAESEDARIQRQLTQAIYEHRLPPGTKLPEVDLARIMGWGRSLRKTVLST